MAVNANPPPRRRLARADAAVGAGILVSRLSGLVRARLFSHFLGQKTIAADAFNAAFRIPNLLQNLFGEGALSGSFIPVHAGLRARGEDRAAAHTARTIFAMLALTMAVLVLLGVAAAPFLVDAIAPGFVGDKRELTVRLVRVLFPGAGLLVASAWCLGVLNSHGRFLLSYTAPVAWNAAMIATLLAFGGRRDLDTLAIDLGWGSVIGSFLQFAVQAPFAWRLSQEGGMVALTGPVREAVRNFVPVIVSRGAVQLTAYIDAMIASLLPTGALTGLSNAQLLYTLPVSLFGVAVSAAELPAMSGDAARDHGLSEARFTALRTRIDNGLERLAVFVVPSAIAFAALGDVVAGTLLQTGRFTPEDSRYVWGILAGSSVGLLASTMARLYSTAHYAIGDPRRPLRFALVRIVVVTVLGYVCAVFLPGWVGINPEWGAAGLTASAGVAGWIEFALLRKSINARIGATGLRASRAVRLWASAGLAAAVAWVVKLVLPPVDPIVRGIAILPAFGLVYFGGIYVLGIPIPGLSRPD